MNVKRVTMRSCLSFQLIRAGELQKDGKTFDTSAMISHDKPGFAAFTLNTNGELSVFNHNGMLDQYAHSSMNAGVPVVAAGEIKVEKGVLKSITTHSGHYRPSLFNVHRFLEHLSNNNVDIGQANIVTFSDPSQQLSGVTSTRFFSDAYVGERYVTPANQIYQSINSLFAKNIDAIRETIQSYKQNGVKNTLFKLKDKVSRKKLTRQRIELAKDFANRLISFKAEITPNLTLTELEDKIKKMDELITEFQEQNHNLSAQNKKEQNKGRLASTLQDFKNQMATMKVEQSEIKNRCDEISSKGKSLY